MYWREQPKQLSLESQRCLVCLACRTLDPPTEPAYGCPDCGMGETLSYFGGETPEVCPACGDVKLELITESACALCRQGEVEEREVYPCAYCGHIRLNQYEYHPCPNRPTQSEGIKLYREGEWTPGGDGKVAYLRLECQTREERVKVNGRLCPGWRKLVERYYAGDKDAFRTCVECAYGWGDNPGRIEAVETEPYPYQAMFKV